MVPLEPRVRSRHYRGVVVVHRDRAGEEGDLATWGAIPAKVCYSMVSSTLKINVILPNPDAFVTNRRTIHRRYPFVFFFSIGVAPIASWIWTTESTVQLWASNSWDVTMDLGFIWLFHNPWINDAEISPSFGQVCLC